MTQLVNDSIELARIGSGPVRLHRAPFPLQSLIRTTAEELWPLLESRELSIDVELSLPPVDIDLKLTGLTVRQVLNNAIKYSPPGSPVQVKAHRYNFQWLPISKSLKALDLFIGWYARHLEVYD